MLIDFNKFNTFHNINKGILSFARYSRTVTHPFGNKYGRDIQNITVYWQENDSDVYVERPYGYDNSQTKVMGADIVYVHELQHLLNICGLNDISYEFQYGKQ